MVLTGICDGNIRLCDAESSCCKQDEEAHVGCRVSDELGHWATHNGAELIGQKRILGRYLRISPHSFNFFKFTFLNPYNLLLLLLLFFVFSFFFFFFFSSSSRPLSSTPYKQSIIPFFAFTLPVLYQ